MAEQRLTRGSVPGGSTYQVPVDGHDGVTRVVIGRDGQRLAQEPHGFPGVVTVDGAGLGALERLRLARTLSLVATVRGLTFCSIEASVEAGGEPRTRFEGRKNLVVELPQQWVRTHGRTVAALRAAVASLLEDLPRVAQSPGEGTGAGPRGEAGSSQAQVLLFRNPFTKDVDRGDARQLNPGSHHLISALRADGHRTVLLDAKLPLQDACARPPDVDDPLDAGQVLTDPDDLLGALARHPDLDLVCLTVLERCIGQIRELCRWIRANSDAWIAIGGPLPTAAPEHCLAHLPEVDVLVRGDGEQVLPLLARTLAGTNRRVGLGERGWRALDTLRGVAVRSGGRLVAAQLDQVNRVDDLDESPLDFALLEPEHVEGGLSLTTSRGCVYACRFCSVHDRQLWRAMSADRVLGLLAAYRARLIDLFGERSRVPAAAMRIQLWDDDFFVDRTRARRILAGLADAGHEISFIQGTAASFFRRNGRRSEWQLDEDLLDLIPAHAFTRTGGLKIGTESFADRELKRLGKPYRVEQLRQLVPALAHRGIRQDHYLVLCNRETSLHDLLDVLETIAELRWLAGPGFSVLQPSWLIHLFPTAIHRTAQRRGLADRLPTAGILRRPDHGEYDYPLVMPDRPRRPEVFEVVRRLPAGMHFGAAGEGVELLEGVHSRADWTYTRVFAGIRAILEDRLAELRDAAGPAARAEEVRIEAVLAGRLAAAPASTVGLVARLSPGLDADLAQPGAPRIEGYLRALLQRAGEEELFGHSVELVAGHGELLLRVDVGSAHVDLAVSVRGDAPAAATTRNLALVVRSPLETDADRAGASRAIEGIHPALELLDSEELA